MPCPAMTTRTREMGQKDVGDGDWASIMIPVEIRKYRILRKEQFLLFL